MNTLESGPPQQAAGPLAWAENDYVTRVFDHPNAVDATHWQALLAAEAAQGRDPQPFATPTYWAALLDSASASPATGWHLQLLTLWREPVNSHGPQLCGACAVYIKSHSRGEYVFDWAWAEAHERHGLPYYPKGVVAVPFTPVPGPRLLAVDASARTALMAGLLAWAQAQRLSSLHLLFGLDEDLATAERAGLMLRHTVQFHWQNTTSTSTTNGTSSTASTAPTACASSSPTGGSAPRPFSSFADFLASLAQDKRKKIRQERRKVTDAGVWFEHRHGGAIRPQDWDFFYTCYTRTYHEHGNAPYLSRDFFQRMAEHQPDHWLMFIAHRADGQPIACSLIAMNQSPSSAEGQKSLMNLPAVAHGRYWGALERVDCLHFEACYYQPIEWCIAHGFDRFEGGAQGEHKMARALLPVRTSSAHWLAHPAFADAVDRYLTREAQGISAYMDDLQSRSPLRRGGSAAEGGMV